MEIWIRYDELLGQGPRPGFETCGADSAYSRVTERFILEAGPRPDTASRRDAIEIAGRSMDASQALRTFDPAAPELADGSVPHQVLPEESEHALWLVPLGVVLYQPGAPGKLAPRDAAAQARSASSREYAGVVAGSVEATGGVVRIHDRAKPYSTFGSEELLRVEGDIRSDGDVRIFGRKLELIASHAESPRLPVQVLRRDDPGAGSTALTLVIGDKQAGGNKLVVARKSGADAYEARMVVTDQGNVGIGTEEPKAPLHLPELGLQIGTATGAATVNNFEIQSSDVGVRALRFLNGDFGSGKALMSLTATGRLGLGETNPSNGLHVTNNLGIRQNAMYLSGDARWSSLTFNAHHNEANTAWEFPDTSKPALTVEMDAIDGFPRFEVLATAPAAGNQSWQSRLFVHGHTGDVGIGTSNPAARLDVIGEPSLRRAGRSRVRNQGACGLGCGRSDEHRDCRAGVLGHLNRDRALPAHICGAVHRPARGRGLPRFQRPAAERGRRRGARPERRGRPGARRSGSRGHRRRLRELRRRGLHLPRHRATLTTQEDEMDWSIERMQQLRVEFATGESQLAELDRHRAGVRDQLLRIEGAIRVLEEQLAASPDFAADPATPR